jgi:cytochrome c oxidase subunit 2
VLSAVVAPLLVLACGCDLSVHPGLARGKELYDTCVPCHGADGHGNQDLGAPTLAGLQRWYVERELTKFQQGIRGAHPDDMEGARMRPMARTLNRPGDVASVAEYIATFPAPQGTTTLKGGNAKAGEGRFTSVCFVCHGANGHGNPDMKSPNLTSQADWYLLVQLDKFKSGMRGAHPADTSGAQMMAMSSTLEDHQAMLDVIAYIRTLSSK